MLYDVNNRGSRKALGLFNEGADHFLMRRGYIVVWSGWIAQVQPGEERLRLDAPPALENGRPVTGVVRAEMVTDELAERMNVTNRPELGAYAPTKKGLAEATLTWRLREFEPRVEIPHTQWKIETTPGAASNQRYCLPKVELRLSGGFQPGYIYELIYEAQGSVVQGLGLAGIRDLVSFLKYDTSRKNPLRNGQGASAAKRTIAFGISQSGRCQRSLLHLGFNADEQGRRVFDGMIPHVAGGGLGFFNHRFASPTRYNSQHVNHEFPCDMFPFTYSEQQAPHTGRTDSLLRRARAANVVPKIMHVQTSAEYWHRSGSLAHTVPLGDADAELPAEVRMYAIGGAQHQRRRRGSPTARQRPTAALPYRLPSRVAGPADGDGRLDSRRHAASAEPVSPRRRRHAGRLAGIAVALETVARGPLSRRDPAPGKLRLWPRIRDAWPRHTASSAAAGSFSRQSSQPTTRTTTSEA